MTRTIVFVIAIVALAAFLIGCGQKEEAAEIREPAGQQEAAREAETSATMKMSAEMQVAQAVDPVCGMSVGAEAAVTAEHEGQTYRFCSAHCQEKFLEDPGKYMSGGHEHMEEGAEQHMEMDHHRMGKDEDSPMIGEEGHDGHGH